MGKVTKRFLVSTIMMAMMGHAAAATDGQVLKPTPAEQMLMGKGTKIVQAFPSVSGLKAIVADNGREKRLFYVTPDGKSLISGVVFDTAGNNVTANDMSRAGVTDVGGGKVMTEAQKEALWARAGQLRWVQEGASSAKVIYVFFDPNCPNCHSTWTTLRSAVQSGKVQVRWLPVAILKDNSKNLAAAIYEARNTSEAMAQMVNRQLQPVRVSDVVNKSVAYNLLLLRDTGFTGVPTIMSRSGGKVRLTMGAPDDKDLVTLLR
ncbi:thiol:disulfide interchange protein DsbG [Chromobacterium haemolyticum]|uniref:thiol:disulfide interchange protein DsbG n=1 Tax=Chromobacterium haemolyticum TaxID=394935 RepID=UPI0024478312|nr:thiol:disulfide interchange protein DsbG [Chromobacterium haemolyticum]MDH0342140.1 thiol:disulfide interchange protein DsbG [Chromobacterium haemolyticum]